MQTAEQHAGQDLGVALAEAPGAHLRLKEGFNGRDDPPVPRTLVGAAFVTHVTLRVRPRHHHHGHRDAAEPQELVRKADERLPQVGLTGEAGQPLHESQRLIGVKLHRGAKQL
jgi:hypothetical protein